MPERDQPFRGRESFRLTPFLLGTIVMALVASGMVIAAWSVNVRSAPPVLGPESGGALPRRGMLILILAVGFAIVAWISVVIAFTRDQIMRHFDAVAAQLKDEAEQEGVFRGMNMVTEERRTPPPTDPAHRVVPFRR